MTRILLLLGRLFTILFGIVAGTLAASLFLHLIVLPQAGLTADEAAFVLPGGMIFSVPFVALFIAYFAFLPAMAIVMLAEALSQRGWLYYALGGALAGLFVLGVFWSGGQTVADGIELPDLAPARGDPVGTGLFLVMLGAGLIGGMAYWAVAGRFAGNWKAARLSRPVPPES